MNRKLPKTPVKQTFEGYMAALTDENRAALEHLRRGIKAAAPEAEECISYGIPAFRLHGRFLVGMAAAAKHCAFYPGADVRGFKPLLKGYDLSKGTVRFQPDKPLPIALVKKLVRARIARSAFKR